MADSKCSLPEAWRNGELTADTIGRCHERLLPDVVDLENDLTAVGKSIEGYIDALNNYCTAGCRVSATFAKLLEDTTLSKISQQFQQVTDKLEHTALNDCSADISSCVLSTLTEFTALLPGIKKELGDYKRCKSRHEKCQGNLESFAHKDLAPSDKGFQQAKERFHSADRSYTEKQEELSQCLSSLEGNRIKMIGASLLSLLHTMAQFNNDMSTMLAPLGEYQSVGDYLQDGEIAPQLKEATTTWCSLAQNYQNIREKELSGEDVYNLLKHKKGEKLSTLQKMNLAKHVKSLLKDYKTDVVSMDDGPVTIPGGFFKNPAGIRVALKGCCSRLESLAINGVNLRPSYHDMVTTLRHEIPNVRLAVASVGKPWHTVSNLEGSDIVQSRQKCLRDLIEPLATQFDIPFTKESFMSFALTVLNEACSEKTILASKIAVQLLYGKDDLVVVKLSPDSSKTRNVRLHCKEKGVNIEVHLTWWVTSDESLFSGILEDDNAQPIFEVNTTYCTMVDYMDFLEDKESRLPSITVEYCNNAKQSTQDCSPLETVNNAPVAPPRSKHYARKYAARKKKSELDSLISRSVNGLPNRTKSPRPDNCQGTASHLSLASETELSEVINFLSGRPRGSPDEADTESMCSTRALSDSGIESVNNAKVGMAAGKVGGAETEDQPKGKKGKKKDKKAAAKSESFKKKKKKRSDRKKEKKKAAAEEQENTGKEEDIKTITEDSQAVKEDTQKSGQEAVIISESLRSVWEQSSKQQQDAEGSSSNTLGLQVPNLASQTSKLCGSQDSIYHSCWSIPELTKDAEESVTKTTTNQEIVPSEYNGGWSKRYDTHVTQASQRSIWSPALPTSAVNENFPRKDVWPASLKRQDGVDLDEAEPNTMVGESVFSLGLEISGYELFPTAKMPSSNSPKSVVEERSERLVQRNVTFQPSVSSSKVWQTVPRGAVTAGQFSERSSSYGEGLHYLPQHEPVERMRLHSHHSDPFLSKNIPWTHGVPPMYMKVRYNPKLIAPYPGDEVAGGFGPLQAGRGPRGFPKQGPNPADRRRTTSQFYTPPRAGPL